MHQFVWAIVIVIALGTSGHVMGQGSGSSRVAPPRSSQPSKSQGSGSSRVAPPRSSQPSGRNNRSVPATPRPPTTAEFAASFWKYLYKADATYRSWRSPGKTAVLNADGPHGPFGRTFLNDLADRNLSQLPTGSVLVREEYGADGQTLRNISVMYRAKGADPKNGNWYWMLYQPDGKLARTPAEQGNREIAGRVGRCIECHRQASNRDFVFVNDPPGAGGPPATPPGR